MMKRLLNIRLVVAVLTIACLTIGLLIVAPIRSSSPKEYDHWLDINDDGLINILDVAGVATAFGTSGQNTTKASLQYDSGWINITDKCEQYFTLVHNLNSTDVIVDITGRTTIDGGVHQRNLGLTGYTPGWSRTYGVDDAYSVVQTDDRGYAIAGQTWFFGDSDFRLVRTDQAGNMLWNQTYGGIRQENAYSVVQTDDRGYAIAGITESFGAGDWDFWLVKTDAQGNVQWNQTYGGIHRDMAYSVVQTDDRGYAIAGFTESFGAGGSDFWLVRTDQAGNMQGSKTYGGTGADSGTSVVQTADGGYTLAGSTSSFGAGGSDFWLVRTDPGGNVQWNKTYGGTDHDYAYSVIETDDRGYAIVGQTMSFGAGDFDAWLVKTDPGGNVQWNKTYGGTDWDGARSVLQTDDGGYAIAQNTRSYGAGDLDLCLIKTDSAGNMQWNQTFGGTDDNYGESVVQTVNGGYTIAGSTGSFITGGSDFWLVKTDVEFGLAWTNSTADSITLYRGATDSNWNYVRVRLWKIKETS